MILDMEVTQLKELPKFGCLKAGARIRVQIRSLVDRVEAQYQARREAEARAVLAARQERARTHPLSDQDRAQVKRILSSGGEVWAAAKDSSDSTVLFQKVRDGLSIGQPAPDFFAKLINPKRDKNLVGIWCESVDRAKLLAQGKRGEFWLMSDFVEAYCWQLSLDSVDAKPAEAKDDAVPAPVAEDAKPAEAEDEAKPAPVAEDAKPAVAEDDKPAEQAEDEAEPAVAGEDDQPAAVAEAADAPAPAEPSVAGPVQGLRTTDKGDGWHELLARTLEEYTADLEIIKRSRNDGTIDHVAVRWSPTRWTQEIYYINSQQKLALKSAKRSVLPQDALVQVHVA